MPNSSTTAGGSRRGGPTFKFYWIENGKVIAVKRYDEAESQVVPYRVFKLIAFVFPNFKVGEHVVKFQDDSDLVELTEEDCVRFNAESGDIQVYLYIFSSKEEAQRTVTPPTVSLQFVSPSIPTQVTFPTPAPPQVQGTVPQPQVACVLQHQVEVIQPEQSQARGPETIQGQSNPQVDNSTNQGPRQEAGDSEYGHAYVVCDGCNGHIPAHRYKCLQCPDFDLCAACESSGMHPEHLMVRVPVHFVHSQGPNNREVLHRVFTAAAREITNENDVVIDLGKQLKDVLKTFGIEVEHIGEGRHCDSRRKHKGKHCPFGPFSEKQRSDSKHHSFKKFHRREMREEARTSHEMETRSGPSAPTSSASFAPSATTATTHSTPFAPSTNSAPNRSHSFVNTQLLPPNPVHVPAPTPAPAPAAPATAVPTAPPATAVPTASPATVTDGAPPVYPVLDNSEVVPMEEDSPRPGEWLMVDSDIGGATSVTAENPTVTQSESVVPFLHSDEFINIALEKLAMMGYKIDDQHLVHLVEDCKGDITRILDCLHG